MPQRAGFQLTVTTPWPRQLLHLLDFGPCVLVSVVSVKGSAPRAAGSRMIVSRDRFEGSIGGGNLEFHALARAREILDAGSKTPISETYGLGPELRQCCGGAVILRFEPFGKPPAWLTSPPSEQLRRFLFTPLEGVRPSCVLEESIDRTPIPIRETPEGLVEYLATHPMDLRLYGAGHVGKAVTSALRGLPFRLTWFDGRPDEFPARIPEYVTARAGDDGLSAAGEAPPDALHLVMTHSHELDEDICHAVLTSGDFAWLGLIGSKTKRARFVHRLRDRGITEEGLERLVCPVGLAGLTGKRPATIAVAIAAQLLADQVPAHLK